MIQETSEAPDFPLDVANGPPIVLSDLWRDKHVLLWFSRGLACPFCRRQMVQLSQIHGEFLNDDVMTVQITPTDPAAARNMLEFFPVPWPYACDPSGRVAFAFGMQPSDGAVAKIASGVTEQTRAWGILLRSPAEPHPEILAAVQAAGPPPARDGGMVIVGQGGRVRFKQPTGRLSLLPSSGALLRTVRQTVSRQPD